MPNVLAYPPQMRSVSVIIPAYNEQEAIGEDLDTIINVMKANDIDFELIVVDDGSTDRTAEIVRGKEGVKLLQHSSNRGTGAAINTGIRYAKHDVVMITDGDGTYPNQDMPKLLSFMDEYDMVIGARCREAGTLRWLRSPTKAFIRMLASYLTDTMIPDLNSGLRCFKKELARKFFSILPSGHSWVSTITLAFLSNGYVVKFVPIDYYPRKGKSTFHPIADTYNYILLVIRTALFFNPLKVFLPISFFLLAVGAGKAVYDIFAYHFHFAPSTVMLVLSGIQVGVVALLADLIVKRMAGRE